MKSIKNTNEKRALRVILAAVIVALVVLFLASCEPRGEPLTKELDRTSIPMEIHVHTYRTIEEVTAAFNQRQTNRGEPYDLRVIQMGWAVWSEQDNRCDIHVPEPRYVREQNTFATWGHELAHCIYGSFHR
jgi:hypothetical protein